MMHREYLLEWRDLFGHAALTATRMEGKHVHMLFLLEEGESRDDCEDRAKRYVDNLSSLLPKQGRSDDQ
jgi:hypothetical protein